MLREPEPWGVRLERVGRAVVVAREALVRLDAAGRLDVVDDFADALRPYR